MLCLESQHEADLKEDTGLLGQARDRGALRGRCSEWFFEKRRKTARNCFASLIAVELFRRDEKKAIEVGTGKHRIEVRKRSDARKLGNCVVELCLDRIADGRDRDVRESAQ